MNYNARKITSILLGLTSAIGTVATAILVAKETPKANEKIKELKNKKEIKKLEYFKQLVPIYWPAGIVCLGTIASSTISSAISLKTQASLIATSTLLSQGWNKYKHKVKDIFGIEGHQTVTNDIADNEFLKRNFVKKDSSKKLYWEEHLGFFECKETDFMAAVTDLNQRLHTPDPDPEGTFYFTTLYKFIKDAKAKVFDKDKLEGCKNLGWTTDYLCDVYAMQCMWVHLEYTTVLDPKTGEYLYTKISFFEDPIFLHDSEMSRFHYKSREDFAHEAEIDMHDADAFALYSNGYQNIENAPYENKVDAIQESFVNSKIDCDTVNDDGRRFIPSNPEGSNIKYADGRDYKEPENDNLVDYNLPDEKDIPSF